MKFGQLMKFKMRNTFLEIPFTKSGGKACPRPLYKNSKLSISLDQLSEIS